jgi:hypothetical protein
MNILNKLEAKCKRISLKSGHLEGAVTFYIARCELGLTHPGAAINHPKKH